MPARPAPQTMPRDKQLRGIKLADVLQRRRLDQALNAKEFAVLAGISYSTAREWFRVAGFPVVQGVVFWQDFVQWRRNQTGLRRPKDGSSQEGTPRDNRSTSQPGVGLSPQAARILAEAG
jgi:hypothetical protein